jgi:hypothetical protein
MSWIQGHNTFSRRAQTNLRTDLGKRTQMCNLLDNSITEKGYTQENPAR